MQKIGARVGVKISHALPMLDSRSTVLPSIQIDHLLLQMIDLLHFLSFFTESFLFQEIQHILKHLENLFSAYHLLQWREVVSRIRSNSNPQWVSLRGFQKLKYRWIQFRIRKRIQCLSSPEATNVQAFQKLQQCRVEILEDAYFELADIRAKLSKARPILFQLIEENFRFR